MIPVCECHEWGTIDGGLRGRDAVGIRRDQLERVPYPLANCMPAKTIARRESIGLRVTGRGAINLAPTGLAACFAAACDYDSIECVFVQLINEENLLWLTRQ